MVVGQEVCMLWIKQIFILINNSRTTWPTSLLMPFLSSLDNLLRDAYIIFKKGVYNLEIEQVG